MMTIVDADVGTLKMRERKMRDWKMRHQYAGVEVWNRASFLKYRMHIFHSLQSDIRRNRRNSFQRRRLVKQESLADVKVTARQQCVYEGP